MKKKKYRKEKGRKGGKKEKEQDSKLPIYLNLLWTILNDLH